MSASRPVTAWEPFSLVEICTVRSVFRSAASVAAESGAARTKLPPSPTNTLASPSRIARTAVTTSNPCTGFMRRW